MKNTIGFWGYPNKKTIQEYKTRYPSAKFVDLDIDFNYPKLSLAPDAYCTIINYLFCALFTVRKHFSKNSSETKKIRKTKQSLLVSFCESFYYAISDNKVFYRHSKYFL